MQTKHDLRWPTLTAVRCSKVFIRHRALSHVQTNIAKIVEVAGWMAYEELPIPDYALPFGIGAGNVDETIDFILTAACIDTAFTDFFSHIKFQVDYAGRHWSDSDALFACMKRALDKGIPSSTVRFWQRLRKRNGNAVRRQHRTAHARRKTQILNQVGTVLARQYSGRFHNFVASCSPRLYDDGSGWWIGSSTTSRFRDVSLYGDTPLSSTNCPARDLVSVHQPEEDGGFPLEDLETMSAFADYIVPVALGCSESPAIPPNSKMHQFPPGDSA